jgi:tryptophanyl-tRNA synthetase
MRPTGKLHLGHLVGALDNWKKLQEDYRCFFMVADWHALMSEYADTSALQDTVLDIAADWIACGISPEKATLFVQSDVREHLELYMIFSVLTPLGLLERCPTYKEQLRQIKNHDLHTYGFLGYPVLQAADIMLYMAQAVPVGEDQLPHIELTRQIVRKFNALCGRDFFPEPAALLTREKRFPGLDGRKMSKSYDNCIFLSEEADAVRAKIMKMFSDPKRLRLSDRGHPDECNVHAYYAVIAPERKPEIDRLCGEARIGCQDAKKELVDRVIAFLEPIQARRKELLKDAGAIREILKNGSAAARLEAERTMRQVREALHLARS